MNENMRKLIESCNRLRESNRGGSIHNIAKCVSDVCEWLAIVERESAESPPIDTLLDEAAKVFEKDTLPRTPAIDVEALRSLLIDMRTAVKIQCIAFPQIAGWADRLETALAVQPEEVGDWRAVELAMRSLYEKTSRHVGAEPVRVSAEWLNTVAESLRAAQPAKIEYRDEWPTEMKRACELLHDARMRMNSLGCRDWTKEDIDKFLARHTSAPDGMEAT